MTAVTMSRDQISLAKRRQIMQAVRQRGTDIEVIVRRAVARLGHYARANSTTLPGRPDLSNQRQKWAILVHDCFWHGHLHCRKTKGGKIPASNRNVWKAKFATNRRGDARRVKELRRCKGFRVLMFWECKVGNVAQLRKHVAAFFGNADAASNRKGNRVAAR